MDAGSPAAAATASLAGEVGLSGVSADLESDIAVAKTRFTSLAEPDINAAVYNAIRRAEDIAPARSMAFAKYAWASSPSFRASCIVVIA